MTVLPAWYYDQLRQWFEWVRGERVSVFPVVAFCVLYFFFVSILAYIRRRRYWRTGRIRMDPKSPHRRQQIVVAAMIEDGFEKAVDEQKLTKKEVKYWRNLIGQHCDLPDLLPKNNSYNQARPSVIKAKLSKLKSDLRKKRIEDRQDKVVVFPGQTNVSDPEPNTVSEFLTRKATGNTGS